MLQFSCWSEPIAFYNIAVTYSLSASNLLPPYEHTESCSFKSEPHQTKVMRQWIHFTLTCSRNQYVISVVEEMTDSISEGIVTPQGTSTDYDCLIKFLTLGKL